MYTIAVATSVDTVEHSPQTQASAILPSTCKFIVLSVLEIGMS